MKMSQRWQCQESKSPSQLKVFFFFKVNTTKHLDVFKHLRGWHCVHRTPAEVTARVSLGGGCFEFFFLVPMFGHPMVPRCVAKCLAKNKRTMPRGRHKPHCVGRLPSCLLASPGERSDLCRVAEARSTFIYPLEGLFNKPTHGLCRQMDAYFLSQSLL